MTPFTDLNRKNFTFIFVLLFYILAVYKWWNGMWLFQMKPSFFNTRFDGTTWLFMKTGIHQWLLGNKTGWILFDVLFYITPGIYWQAYRKNAGLATWVAAAMLVVNFIYTQCYTLFPTNSAEGYLQWLFFPVLLMMVQLKSFYFVMHGIRYFFLFFFASAAIWKIRQGGVFFPGEMSGILLMQHKEYLVSAPDYWYTHFIYWLIKHQTISYALYLGATLIEFVFIIGFFTRKYDKILVWLFVLFLLMDLLIMRIPYFEVLPFLIPMFYSKYGEPEVKESKGL